MVQAGRPALEAADDDQVRQRTAALGLAPAPLELAALAREALAGTRDHGVVGGIAVELAGARGVAGVSRRHRASSPRRGRS